MRATLRTQPNRVPGPGFRHGALRVLCGTALAVVLPSSAQARDLIERADGSYRLELRSAFKGSWLLSFPREDAVTGPQVASGAGLFRLRFSSTATLGEHFTVRAAYEHRAMASSAGGVGLGLLPPTARAPFRLRQVDRVIVDNVPSYTHRHELDRAFVAMHLPFMELTIGRQAIGLGRGVLFGAVDIFAPFAPTEVDREWRRGVDALHAELRIPSLSVLSGDFILSFGDLQREPWQNGAILGRLRAVVGDMDGALILGRRGQDNMVASVVSATVGDAEAHAEYALFGTDGRGIDGGWLGSESVVMKALFGGSYVFGVGNGLRVWAEYHYSGFGVARITKSSAILFNPSFQARFLRGDSQLLGRHALALVIGYDLTDELAGALTYIQSPVDGSGMVAPAVTWNHSDNVTLVANCFVPWGTRSEASIPKSEWGASPFTLFVQARLYD